MDNKKIVREIALPTFWLLMLPIILIILNIYDSGLAQIGSIIIIGTAWILGIAEWQDNALFVKPKLEGKENLRQFWWIWGIGLLFPIFVILAWPGWGVYCVMVTTIAIYAGDAAGWLVGSYVKLPNKPLSEYIEFAKWSPKKTLNGTLADLAVAYVLMAASFAVATNLGAFQNCPEFWWLSLLAVVVFPVAGLFGDLNESRLKRIWGLEKSAQYSPVYLQKAFGRHGGILDRLDSLTFASFAVVTIIICVMIAAVITLIGVIAGLIFALTQLFFFLFDLAEREQKKETSEVNRVLTPKK